MGPTTQKSAPNIPPQLYDMLSRLIAAAMKMIYENPQTMHGIIKMVSASPDPVSGIVQATEMIVGELAPKAQGVPPQILARVRAPVAVLLLELCVAAKVVKYDQKIIGALLAKLNGAGAQPAVAGAAAPQQPPPAGIVANAQQPAPQGA